jgi:hypothetical protein
MITYLTHFDGRQGPAEFQPHTPDERNVLLKIERLQHLNDSEHLTVMHWIESALSKRGYRRCHLIGIEGAGHRFTFTIEQEGSSLGSW